MPGAQSSHAFKDFDSLIDTIQRWVSRPDLVAEIPDFVWLCECELQADIAFRLNDATTTGTSVTDQEWIQLPSDYVEGRLFRWEDNDAPPINVRSWDAVSRLKKAAITQTRAGVVHKDRLYVGAVPGAVAWTLFYQAGVEHLSDSNQSNTILELYPGCLLYGALKHMAPFIVDDPRLPLWMGLYSELKEVARMQEWGARASHGPLMVSPDVAVR